LIATAARPYQEFEYTLIEISRRSDLAALDNVQIEPRDVAGQIFADSVFAVMRRTLH